MNKPTVNRSVHFQHETPELYPKPLAAIITAVGDDGSIDLTIFMPPIPPTGAATLQGRIGAPFSENPKPGHWNWPPRI